MDELEKIIQKLNSENETDFYSAIKDLDSMQFSHKPITKAVPILYEIMVGEKRSILSYDFKKMATAILVKDFLSSDKEKIKNILSKKSLTLHCLNCLISEANKGRNLSFIIPFLKKIYSDLETDCQAYCLELLAYIDTDYEYVINHLYSIVSQMKFDDIDSYETEFGSTRIVVLECIRSLLLTEKFINAASDLLNSNNKLLVMHLVFILSLSWYSTHYDKYKSGKMRAILKKISEDESFNQETRENASSALENFD